jgi:hypothetical protein
VDLVAAAAGVLEIDAVSCVLEFGAVQNLIVWKMLAKWISRGSYETV